MGRYIARQPNGLLTVFSSVVDCPILVNLTDEDYINYCAEEAKDNARDALKYRVKSFQEVIEDFMPNNMTEEEFSAYLLRVGYDETKKKRRGHYGY